MGNVARLVSVAVMTILWIDFETRSRCDLPSRGVYAGRVVLAGGRYPAAINLGYSPTFTDGDDPPLRLEAFILDYEGGDLYGQRIRVEFLDRLRDERRFPTPAELVAQVQEDIDRTREVASGA